MFFIRFVLIWSMIVRKRLGSLTYCSRQLSLASPVCWKVPSSLRKDASRLLSVLNVSKLPTGHSVYLFLLLCDCIVTNNKNLFECSKDVQNFRNLEIMLLTRRVSPDWLKWRPHLFVWFTQLITQNNMTVFSHISQMHVQWGIDRV